MKDVIDGNLDPRITAATKFMRRVSENDSVNRRNALYWTKFRDGEQWPPEIQNSRTLEQRPCITVNKTDVYCRHVENQQRQQRPRIKVEPTNGEATKRNAGVIQGMLRHIETNKGGGALCYDHGFSGATTGGVGFARMLSEYTRDDSFEQELYFAPVFDPNSVYYDDNSVMPDGSDAEEVLIVADMGKEAFEYEYPGKDSGAGFVATESNADWISPDRVRTAEYFTIKKDRAKLVRLSTGEIGWEDKIDPKALAAGVEIVERRDSARRTVKWCKVTAMQVLEEKDLPGRWIPVFPFYGRVTIIDGKRRLAGLVKNAVGPQQMSNFWKTAMTESVALAPKAKWIIEEGQDEGHVEEWNAANRSATATLRYKRTNIDGVPGEKPFRVQPEPPPSGAMAMAQSVDNDLSAVLGIVEPAQRIAGNVSGKALNAERLQSDQNTYDLYDNMTRTIAFMGRCALDVLPTYYPEPGRVVRIVGDDGRSKTAEINKPDPDDPEKIINDISVGQYDIVMDTGPGYNTKRQEALETMTPLFEAHPELMKIAGDVYFRNVDSPGAETIADRLAAANPLSEVDEESDVPPQAQTMIKGLQQQLEQAKGAIQQMEQVIQSRADVESMKQAAETHRTEIKAKSAESIENAENTAWMHDVATRTQTEAHNTVIKSETAKIIAQMNNDAKEAIETFKAGLAVKLAKMDAERADQASDETTERAI